LASLQEKENRNKLITFGFGKFTIYVSGGTTVKVVVEPSFAFTEEGFKGFGKNRSVT